MTAILLGIGIAGFLFTAYNRWVILQSARPVKRPDKIGTRIWKVVQYAVGQKRFFLHGRASGLMHAFVFWGFCAVGLRTILLLGKGFDSNFGLAFELSAPGIAYHIVMTAFEYLVIIGCVTLLLRRLILKPKRLTLSLEANIILLTILSLMVTDFMIEYNVWLNFAYFAHIILILGFLNWLPYGKHFHIITSLPNVFLQKLEPGGALAPINLEDEKATSFGVNEITGFNWKQYLDLYTCTECGRCTDQCPADATGKPLSPKQLTIDLRDHLYEQAPRFKTSLTIAPSGKSQIPSPKSQINSNDQNTNSKQELPELINNIIKPDTIWACTTCKACEEACPVFIEYVDKIVDMRRHMVLMQGNLEPTVQTTLRNIETNSNPWGIGHSTRADWAKGLGIKTFNDDKNVEYLYFVGCAGSFDERAKKVTKAFVKCLQKAEISFGILGEEEKCTGDSARRIGNEYLFQTLAKDNIATFNKYGVKKILTTCPHCYNTLKNEYPQFGGRYEVWHHTEFLLGLIKSNHLSLRAQAKQSSALDCFVANAPRNDIAYHDSCYLGRYNNIYDAPRELLKSAGYKPVDPKESRDIGRCCGAGGGRMWMEEKLGTRINHKRFGDLQKTGAETFATACPFCLTMLSDAVREKHASNVKILDIAEILADKL